MNIMNRNLPSAAALVVFLLLFGCSNDNPVDTSIPDESDGRLTITNDDGILDGQMDYSDTSEVEVDTTMVPTSRLAKRSGTAAIRLRLRATSNPPTVSGQKLQATHVVLNGNYAYVSYNTQGNTYLGGVDIIDISNVRRPSLRSRATIVGTDVSAIFYANNKAYLAEATEDTGFVYPAVIEEIEIQNNRLTLNSRRKGVSSYVATDIKVSGGKIWVTSGSGGAGTGGLTILDATTLNVITEDLFLDARSVDISGSTAAVLQGSGATLRTYNTSTNGFLTSYYVGGATIPESKSILDVVLDRAFVAAGDAGVRVFSFTSGTVIDSLARVTVSGLSPTVTVTNAVSISRDLLFAANGEAGVYVAEADFNMESVPTSDPDLRYQGSLKFSTKQSANFVASNSDILFIATGTGGLKIVEIL
ncbi:MAG TPA: hypothetical protein VJN65_06495 [Bacteroidota bacterium]|nr:hypothetical protein [Bacteroidota bacterium]